MAISVSEAWTSVETVERNVANLSNTQKNELANFVNHEIYDLIVEVAPSRIETSTSVSASDGVNTVALPSDFDSSNTEQSGLFKLDANGNVADEMDPITRGDNTNEGWRIEGSNMIINSSGAQTLTLFYIPTLAELTASNLSGDFTTIGKKYLEMVRFGLLLQWAIFMRDPIKQNNYSLQYEAHKEAFANSIRRTPQVFSLPTING